MQSDFSDCLQQNIRLAERISLSLSIFNNKRKAPIEVKLPKSTVKFLEAKKLQQISLKWDNHLKLAIVYENGVKANKKVNDSKYCGVDLGEIHSITGFSEAGNAIIITGRYLRSINRYQIKEVAKLSKLISRCKEYSRRWCRLRRAKRRLLNKTNNQIRDCNHKITRAFVNWAIAHNITKVYVGDVEGVQKNSRNYRCQCGYKAHRDIHGARNILSLAKFGRFELETPIKEQTYLRTA